MKSPKTSLFVLQSDDPARNLVLRRGPTRQAAAFLWNARTDEIMLGQWLNGKLYNDRCDISPDGFHWAYFAMGRGGMPHTVVAKTPWFTALDYYPEGDTWTGGAAFDADSQGYVLHTWGVDKYKARKTSGMIVELDNIAPQHQRLLRQGWNPTGDRLYTKAGPRGWTLHKDARQHTVKGRAFDMQQHRLEGVGNQPFQPDDIIPWADLSARQVVFARGGCLWRAKMMGTDGFAKPKLIHDFNAYRFEERRAPYGTWSP